MLEDARRLAQNQKPLRESVVAAARELTSLSILLLFRGEDRRNEICANSVPDCGNVRIYRIATDVFYDRDRRPRSASGYHTLRILLWICGTRADVASAFLPISSNPIRYRPIMLIAIAEKLTFSIPVVLLYLRGELGIKIAGPSLVDPVLAALFYTAYIRTREATILKT